MSSEKSANDNLRLTLPTWQQKDQVQQKLRSLSDDDAAVLSELMRESTKHRRRTDRGYP